ncbi:MAG: hypothetical protein RLZZ241_1049 [Bacteroidota bacterium]
MIPEFLGALGLQMVPYHKNLLWCSAEITLQEAAKRMNTMKVGSILIGTAQNPEGILTDTDLRRAVAEGANFGKTPVSRFMSAKLWTCTPDTYAVQALHLMLQEGISHLGIVSEAAAYKDVVGIISQRDLMRIQDLSPAGILYSMYEAESIPKLTDCVKVSNQMISEYLQQGIPYTQLAEIRTLLNDVLTKRVISLILESHPAPSGVSFCWIALGSQGRQEQLFPTDQDNAIIFSDVPAHELEATRKVFLNIASQINSQLNLLGLAFCPAGMMAKNPQWCLNLSEWQQRFSSWIHKPDDVSLLHSTIFFDYRGVWGDLELEKHLTQHIKEHLLSHPLFLNYLGIDALKNPKPLGFLNRLSLEPSGSYRGMFDLKGRLLMPYIDAARLLLLNSGMADPKNTLSRFSALENAEPQNSTLFNQAAEAFEIIAGLRARLWSTLKSADGRYLEVKDLSKNQRHTLRYAAKILHELQELLITRFQLSQLL